MIEIQVDTIFYRFYFSIIADFNTETIDALVMTTHAVTRTKSN